MELSSPLHRSRVGSFPRLSPADSVSSLSQFRPSLVWLFNHIRRDDREALTKADLRLLLGAEVGSAQLDAAFEHLDTDGNGEISLDEFLAGFARFLCEAPHTGNTKRLSAVAQLGSLRRRSLRLAEEQCVYEPHPGEEEQLREQGKEPPENFQHSLVALSSHNRHSIEGLWSSLSQANPELLGDFEDFVAEIACEVEDAQRALETQRKVNKQTAIELHEEVESRLNDASTHLQIQTAIVKQQAKVKLEERLFDKESELLAVRQTLSELETEVLQRQQVHCNLEQQLERLDKEKQALAARLEASERQHQGEGQPGEREQDASVVSEKEVELLQLKREYEREISELKERLEGYEQFTLSGELLGGGPEGEEEGEGTEEEEEEEEGSLPGSIKRPDLLGVTSFHNHSRSSLMDEILRQEGVATPILRGEPLMRHASLSLAHTGSRSHSLPNLDQIGPAPDIAVAAPLNFVPVYVGRRLLADFPLHTHTEDSGLEMSSIDQGSVEEEEEGGQEEEEEGGEEEEGRERAGEEEGGRENETQKKTSPVPSPAPPKAEPAVSSQPAFRQRSATTVPLSWAARRPRGRGVPQPRQVPESRVVTGRGWRVGEESGGRGRGEADEGRHSLAGSDSASALYKPLEFIENLATQPDHVFKILVVGNSYVGKSSFLMRLCTNVFTTRYAATIGVDFYSKALRLDDNVVSLQLWDTAGQERFQSVTRAYYRGAQGVILMYDISQEESFIAVKSWISSIQENVEQMPLGLLLVGNKCDLDEDNEREVATETGETFAKIYGADFIEASAKTGYNVSNALIQLVRLIKSSVDGAPIVPQRRSGVQVNAAPQGTLSRCCGR